MDIVLFMYEKIQNVKEVVAKSVIWVGELI